MTTAIDTMTLADLLRQAAKAEILPRFRRLGSGDVRAKTEATDLVTEADEQAERMMKAEAAQPLAGGALHRGRIGFCRCSTSRQA